MYTRLVYTITILSLQIHDLTPIVFANSLLRDIFFLFFLPVVAKTGSPGMHPSHGHWCAQLAVFEFRIACDHYL